jgi:hypothetical protein
MTVENNKIIKSIFISFFLILSPKNAEGALVLFQTNFLKFAFYIRQYIILLSMFKSNILTSLFALFVFFIPCRITSGAFTIDSSMPTLRYFYNNFYPTYHLRN